MLQQSLNRDHDQVCQYFEQISEIRRRTCLVYQIFSFLLQYIDSYKFDYTFIWNLALIRI